MSANSVAGLVGNPAAFEALVGQLLSSDNEARKSAEAVYEALKAHADACLTLLLGCLSSSESIESRSFCAIMLRKARPRAHDDKPCGVINDFAWL